MKLYIREGLRSLKNIRADKKAYKAIQLRVKALPTDYRQVYKAVESYLWEFGDTSGMNTMAAVNGMLELFEEGVRHGQPVKAITGDDVGEFAEGLSREIENTWVAKRKAKLTKRFK